LYVKIECVEENVNVLHIDTRHVPIHHLQRLCLHLRHAPSWGGLPGQAWCTPTPVGPAKAENPPSSLLSTRLLSGCTHFDSRAAQSSLSAFGPPVTPLPHDVLAAWKVIAFQPSHPLRWFRHRYHLLQFFLSSSAFASTISVSQLKFLNSAFSLAASRTPKSFVS
jgi:hypothetical protein